MLLSQSCHLKDKDDKERTDLGECVFDQGGYFIINGSEKVLIAQERQAYNRVYVWTCLQSSAFAPCSLPLSSLGVEHTLTLTGTLSRRGHRQSSTLWRRRGR